MDDTFWNTKIRPKLKFILIVLIMVNLYVIYEFNYRDRSGDCSKFEYITPKNTIATISLDAEIKNGYNLVYYRMPLETLGESQRNSVDKIVDHGSTDETLLDSGHIIAADEYAVSVFGRRVNGVISSEVKKRFNIDFHATYDEEKYNVFSFVDKKFVLNYPFEDIIRPEKFQYNGTSSEIECFGIRGGSSEHFSRFAWMKKSKEILYNNGQSMRPGCYYPLIFLRGIIIRITFWNTSDEVILAKVFPDSTLRKTLVKIDKMIDSIKNNDYYSIIDVNDEYLKDNGYSYPLHFCRGKNLCKECINECEKGMELLKLAISDNAELNLKIPKMKLNLMLSNEISDKSNLNLCTNLNFVNLFRSYYLYDGICEQGGTLPEFYDYTRPYFLIFRKPNEKLPYLVVFFGNDELLVKNEPGVTRPREVKVHGPGRLERKYSDFIDSLNPGFVETLYSK